LDFNALRSSLIVPEKSAGAPIPFVCYCSLHFEDASKGFRNHSEPLSREEWKHLKKLPEYTHML
jgi:hypothetical protein